jgi:hypothetical protein
MPRIGMTGPSLPAEVKTAFDMMPRAMADDVTATRLVIRPSMRATSARRSRGRPNAEPAVGMPSMPLMRNTAAKPRAAARVHASVCRRLTGTPRRAARSVLSALARMATPTSVRCSSKAISAMAIGATTSPSRSLLSKKTPPIERLVPNGGSSFPTAMSRSHKRGRSSAMPTSTWLKPMVAIVTRRRGDRKNRRITRRSTTAPRATASSSPIAAATG